MPYQIPMKSNIVDVTLINRYIIHTTGTLYIYDVTEVSHRSIKLNSIEVNAECLLTTFHNISKREHRSGLARKSCPRDISKAYDT